MAMSRRHEKRFELEMTIGNMSSPSSDIHTYIHGWSGAFAGSISTLLLYPMENLKTRLQTDKERRPLKEIVIELMEQEGILGLYKGMTPMLAGNFISSGIYFFWYQKLKDIFGIAVGDTLGTMKVSSLSGIITTVFTNPFWVVQTRTVNTKILDSMIRNEGIQSLFKGLTTSLILVINPIIQFIAYEFLKQKLSKLHSSQFLIHFICGALSKALATFITFPYQVIRTVMHVEKGAASRKLGVIIQDIYKNEGFEGFFRGLSPKLIQTVLNSAFMLAFYEKIVQVISSMVIPNTTATPLVAK